MEQESIRVIIVDDHQMIRETWKMLLERDKRIMVIGECSSGSEAIECAHTLEPDIILMDINMHPINGFEATREILQQHPSIKIIGISINNHSIYARNMLQLGAKGYVTKISSKDEMIEAILQVNQGNVYLCKEIEGKMIKN